MSTTTYKDHPLAEILPLMETAELEELATDIRQHGQRTPITLYENKILDGRNRYRACQIANIEPKVRHFTSGDAVAFIVSANILRRHLTTSQRALVAAKLTNLSNGQHQTSYANLRSTSSISETAKELQVSPRTVTTAREVLRTAPRREVEAVERGEKTVRAVATETRAKAEAKEKHFDKTDYPIPESILEDWQRADAKAHGWLTKISQVRSELKSHLDDQDVIVASITNTTLADLNNAYTSVKCAIPYAVCTLCQGHQRKKCNLCKHRGFLDEFAWRSFVTPEIKAMREVKK